MSRGFYIIWSTQFASMFGSQLTAFAIGVWLFQRTGSVISFTQFVLFSTLPALLMMPWSGAIADQWNKRSILVVSELVAVGCTATMALLFWLDVFHVWQLYALQAVLSISIGLQGPAASAAITTMVPKEHYGRASGMYQIATAVSQFAAPMLAAVLLGRMGIFGILVLDVLTFLVAIVGVLVASIPPAPTRPTDEGAAPVSRSALGDVRWALGFLRQRPAMGAVFVYRVIGALFTGMVLVLIGPLVLAQHSEKVFAAVSTCGAMGALSSGLLLVVWGGMKRWTPLVLVLNIVQGLAIALAGLQSSAMVLCACAFVVMLCSSTLAGSTSAIWRRKVPHDRQGNFAAFQQAIGLAILPVSASLGGVLAQYVFEPALMPGHAWSQALGPWFGTGPGRGTSVLFVAMGMVASLVALLSLLDRRVYRVEAEVPDAV
ncbi:MFS transporter [Roseateles sp. SL47]|uniref:MFS transporter n=1 Tax=Roseateles sp. SL47 TaxID=2995138 RepID=UPI00226D6CDF|nr:MFS transporter [Roseateles sp. SL47]WAC73172.1 MFS transporter [Roseateles sp. SL47]